MRSRSASLREIVNASKLIKDKALAPRTLFIDFIELMLKKRDELNTHLYAWHEIY